MKELAGRVHWLPWRWLQLFLKLLCFQTLINGFQPKELLLHLLMTNKDKDTAIMRHFSLICDKYCCVLAKNKPDAAAVYLCSLEAAESSDIIKVNAERSITEYVE